MPANTTPDGATVACSTETTTSNYGPLGLRLSKRLMAAALVWAYAHQALVEAVDLDPEAEHVKASKTYLIAEEVFFNVICEVLREREAARLSGRAPGIETFVPPPIGSWYAATLAYRSGHKLGQSPEAMTVLSVATASAAEFAEAWIFEVAREMAS